MKDIALLQYDPLTGIVKWLDKFPREHFNSDRQWKTKTTKCAGKVVGTLCSGGYLQIRLHGKLEMLHRVIWYMVHNKWPTYDIDHEDHNRSNNRILNLRDIPQEHNNARKVNNKSGHSGIFEQKRNTKRPWVVQVFHKGKYLTQQSFAGLQDAITHRDDIRRQAGLTQL